MKKGSVTKKILALTILSLFLFSFVIADVGQAETEVAQNVAEGTKGVLTGISGFLSEILSPFFGEKELLTRVFFALLLGMIIYSIVGQLFSIKNRVFVLALTFVITALSLLALPSNFLEAIRTQYGAMGAAILSIIPFAIILVFTIKVENKLIANLTWVFFLLYYFGLYAFSLINAKGGIVNGFITGENIPYLIAIIAGIFMTIMIGRIRKWFSKGQISSKKEKAMADVEFRKLGREIEREETEARTGV